MASETNEYCAGTVTEYGADHCINRLTDAEQQRRSYAQRLTWQGPRLLRFEELNGYGTRGNPDAKIGFKEYWYTGQRLVGTTERSRNGVLRRRTQLSSDSSWAFWFDEQGRPLVEPGSRASGVKRELNGRGRVVQYLNVDAGGNPTPASNGSILVKLKRNAQGAVLEEAYFTEAGSPARDHDGVHRRSNTVNARGLAIGSTYYDVLGVAMADRYGVAQVETDLDDVGNVMAERYFDLEHRPVLSSESAAASYRVERDAHGSEISRTYFDVSGAPTLCKWGYATRKQDFDAVGDTIQYSFFGVKAEPIRSAPHSHHLLRLTRDARGNVLEERYFDVDGRPMADELGAFGLRYAYDERDNVTLSTFIDAQGKPTSTWHYFASWASDLDGDRQLGERYFEPGGRLADQRAGYARWTQTYDELGIASARHYFDARGRQVQPHDDCTDISDRANIALTRALQPLLSCSKVGADPLLAFFKAEYDAGGRLTSSAYVGYPVDPVSDCLDQKLAKLGLEPAPHACRSLHAVVDFVLNVVLVGREP